MINGMLKFKEIERVYTTILRELSKKISVDYYHKIDKSMWLIELESVSETETRIYYHESGNVLGLIHFKNSPTGVIEGIIKFLDTTFGYNKELDMHYLEFWEYVTEEMMYSSEDDDLENVANKLNEISNYLDKEHNYVSSFAKEYILAELNKLNEQVNNLETY